MEFGSYLNCLRSEGQYGEASEKEAVAYLESARQKLEQAAESAQFSEMLDTCTGLEVEAGDADSDDSESGSESDHSAESDGAGPSAQA